MDFRGQPVFKIWKLKGRKEISCYLIFLFFRFVIHLITLEITTITSITSPSMSIRSRTEIHLMFLAGLMVKDTFLFKIILDLIIFYINFHLKECSERGDFCKLTRTVSFIYIFNRLHSFSLYTAIYLLIKKLQLKTCNFLLPYSER